jgi:hypothetical protein
LDAADVIGVSDEPEYIDTELPLPDGAELLNIFVRP